MRKEKQRWNWHYRNVYVLAFLEKPAQNQDTHECT